jgi:hypothetical protein
VITSIPDESIAEGASFTPINLDEFMNDVDDNDTAITWTVGGGSNLLVTVADRVASISAQDPDWNGQEILVFTATDPQGASDRDTAVFTITGVNDAPVLSLSIPDTTARIGQSFLFVLDPNTFTDVDSGDQLVLSASMVSDGGTPAWLSFDASTGTFSGIPAESDEGRVETIVTASDSHSEEVADTFYITVVDATRLAGPMEGPELSLYPNPSTGRFVAECRYTEGIDLFLEIFNEKGQLVWSRKTTNGTGTFRERVDLSHAGNGLYFLRAKSRSGMASMRFIISD